MPSTHDVAGYLAEIQAPPDLIADLAESANEPDGALWLAVGLPDQRRQLNTLLEIERSAVKLTFVSPLLLPGVVQTAAYARSIMTGNVPTKEVDTRVMTRVGRRDALVRAAAPVSLLALIGECALEQTIGGPEVMVDQLRDLTTLAERPNIDLRIVPSGAGWHPGLEGPFELVESVDRNPVVQLETRRSSLFFHRPEDTELYQEAVSTVCQVAMSADQSSALIADVIERMESTK